MSRKSAVAVAAALFTSMLINTALAVGYGGFGMFDDAALLFPQDHINPGFGPRLFMNGMPPIPTLPDKQKRQTPDQCGPDQHSCLEIGPAGAAWCCRNDQYCFLNATWQPQCCGQGTTCGSPCAEDALFCNSTVVSTVTVATSATITVVEQTSDVAACCGRRCSSSSFLCQTDFGGQCCEYGAQCLSGGLCLFTSTTAMPTVVTPIPPGCSTSQYACSEGGGCCSFGSTCTSTVSGTFTSQACAANLTVVDSGGLSEGAKVGIGVGIAVGAAVVIGALTWFFVRRRRDARSRRGGATQTGSGPGDEGPEGDLVRPFMRPGVMSDIYSPSTLVGGRPPLHETGLTYNYYGPDPVAGPFTDRTDSTPGRNPSTEPRSSPGFFDHAAIRANQYPDRPNDIVNPVELNADAVGGATRVELEDKKFVDEVTSTPVTEDKHGPFELYGSPGSSPTPMTAEEAERRRTQNLSPTPPPAAEKQEKKDEQK
ncbi:hypothetical protein F4818DRAFT_289346 [Hypoxylon cercidicola]|nr:hypothetical protein F4818DRAFT_289346 [Hypoxylon cercidicola]